MRSRSNAQPFIIISVACTVLGLVVAGLVRGWIIVQLPTHTTPIATAYATQQKTCAIWFFGTQGWRSEKKKCIWPEDTAQATEHLVNIWLTVLEEENILTTPVKLTAALISPEHTAYLSFDRSPFTREASLHAQWMLIEGLLKTLRLHIPDIRQVVFLVNNQPLINRHLDLENPWPIQGFATDTSA